MTVRKSNQGKETGGDSFTDSS